MLCEEILQSTKDLKWVELLGSIADDAYLLIMQGSRYAINLRRRKRGMRRRKESTLSYKDKQIDNEIKALYGNEEIWQAKWDDSI